MIPYLQQSFSYDITKEGTLTTIDYTLSQFIAFTRTTDASSMHKLNNRSDDKLELSDDNLIENDKHDTVAVTQEEKDNTDVDLIKSPNLKQTTLTQQYETDTKGSSSAISPTKSGNESSFGDDSGLSFFQEMKIL
jgi:hypothetical protein